MLRYKADRRSLVFMAITTGTLIYNWSLDEFYWPTFLLACFMPMTVYVMTHNHNHVPFWKYEILNKLQSYWLTIFYGFPTFAWIPTHNRNHHTHGNRSPGDHTITYRISEKNNLFTLLSYPIISSSKQMKSIFRFLTEQLRKRPGKGLFYLSQVILLVAFVVCTLLIDWKKSLLYVIIPHQIGLTSVLLINYIQHVHADEESRWNHSRNFVGGISNWIMMNNGYHTIHHEYPHLHWSLAKEEHDKIAHLIAPQLKVNLLSYLFSNYILGIFFKRFRTKSMRLERITRENKGDKHRFMRDAKEQFPAC